MSPHLVEAQTRAQFAQARALFKEYAAALGFDLCFQGFEQELANMEIEYGLPKDRLFLALEGSDAVGCAGLREFAPGVCEMKRLYVRPEGRRLGVGRMLAEKVIAEARTIGHQAMRLDTMPWMKEALALYESLGFRDTSAYRHNPVPGARYLELDLRETPETKSQGDPNRAPGVTP